VFMSIRFSFFEILEHWGNHMFSSRLAAIRKGWTRLSPLEAAN
jgi:hypothetical protein